MRRRRTIRGVLTIAALGAVAAPLWAQDGLAPIGGPGRMGARAGAGAAAADDPFGPTRNPATLARLRRAAAAVGALGVRVELEPRRSAAATQRSLFGGPAVAMAWPLGAVAVRGWADPFAQPVRAGLADDTRQGEGRFELVLDAAPRLVEVRARGPLARVTDVAARVEPLGGGPAIATQTAAGGELSAADFRPLLRWRGPAWPAGRAKLVIYYAWAFEAPPAGGTVPALSRIEVRCDVDGRERERVAHSRPAEPDAGGAPRALPTAPPVAGPRNGAATDGPDADLVRRLERGGWRVGVALAPAALVTGAVDAPGRLTGYAMDYLSEAGTVALAGDLNEHLSLGAAVQLYAGLVHGLQAPVVMPDGFGGTQPGALVVDQATTAGVGASAGCLWDPTPGWTFGLYYQSAAATRAGPGRAEVRGLSTFGGAVGGTTGTWDVKVRNLGLPQRAGASLAWRPFGDALLLAADCTWWDWSNSVNDVRLVLENPDDAGFQATGAGIHRVRIALNWEDRWTCAVGISWRALPPLLLHAGYAWGRNPYTAGAVHPLIPAIIKHHVAGGATVKVGRFTGDAGVVWGLPAEARLVDVGASGTRVRAWSLAVQLALGFEF